MIVTHYRRYKKSGNVLEWIAVIPPGFEKVTFAILYRNGRLIKQDHPCEWVGVTPEYLVLKGFKEMPR